MANYYCPSCDAQIATLGSDTTCPICSGQAVVPIEEIDSDSATLSFTIFGCDQCGRTFEVGDGESHCVGCGVERDVEEDPKVVARTTAYRHKLDEYREKLRHANVQTFVDRGPARLAEDTYFSDFSEPILEELSAKASLLTDILGMANWDDPENVDTVAAVANADALFTELAQLALRIKRTPPPFSMLAYHRSLVLTVLDFGWSSIRFMETLFAPNRTAALEERAVAQRSLDRAGSSASKAMELLQAIWPWIRGQGQTLAEAEERYGAGFRTAALPELQLLARYDPECAGPFWSSAIVSSALHDRQRRYRRYCAAKSILEGATASNLLWTGTSTVLFEEIFEGWVKLREHEDRLVHAIEGLRGDKPKSSIGDVLTASNGLLEGPFKRFGAILSVALKATGDSSVVLEEISFNRARNISDSIDSLGKRFPVLIEKFDLVTRNASAHEDVTIEDDKVVIKHVTPSGKTKAARFSYDDVVDYAANVHEAGVAIAVAMVSWLLAPQTLVDVNLFRSAWLEY